MGETKRKAEASYREHTGDLMASCRTCGLVKHPREMSKYDRGICKPCKSAATRAWQIANPKAWDRHARKSHLMKKYGITIEEFDRMFAEQGEACAICKVRVLDSRGFRPHIDHCHDTGKVRGILCGRCNRALGQFEDDATLLRSAVAYLEKSE